MALLTATELSSELGVSKGRVSQYVAEGKLAGCFEGDGRRRRFDLAKCAEALGRTLDKPQLLANGAQTRLALARIADDFGDEGPVAPRSRRTDGRLPENDQDEYTLTALAIKQEDLRKKRRENEIEDGRYVLASESERQVSRMLAREIAGFETVIRDGSRAVADRLGVEFKAARQILMETWRAHRTGRAEALADDAGAATLTAAEKDADI